MIYSAEVQHMCPVAKGAYHGPAPIPEEGKWVQAKEIERHLRPDPRHRLVRPPAGRLQADPEREERRH